MLVSSSSRVQCTGGALAEVEKKLERHCRRVPADLFDGVEYVVLGRVYEIHIFWNPGLLI